MEVKVLGAAGGGIRLLVILPHHALRGLMGPNESGPS